MRKTSIGNDKHLLYEVRHIGRASAETANPPPNVGNPLLIHSSENGFDCARVRV